VKEAKLVVMMDDLDFGIRDVTFEAKVLNRYVEDWYIFCLVKYLSFHNSSSSLALRYLLTFFM